MSKIFDSAEGEIGGVKEFSDGDLNAFKNAYVQCQLGAGDTVVFEGKIDEAASFVVLETFTDNTLKGVTLPRFYRARRTVDGGGDSQVYIDYSVGR